MVRFLPMTVTGVILNVIIGLFVAHIPLVYLVVIGTGATAVAALLFAIIDETASYWAYNFPAAVLSVFGADFIFASGAIYVAKAALPGEQSVAGGLLQTLIQLGSAFGIAVSTIVHDAGVRRALKADGGHVENGDLGTAPHAAQLRGYRDGFWATFAFAAFGACVWRGLVVGARANDIPQRWCSAPCSCGAWAWSATSRQRRPSPRRRSKSSRRNTSENETWNRET